MPAEICSEFEPILVRHYTGVRSAMAHSLDVVEVLRVTVDRNEITADAVPELRALFNIDKLPLAEAYVEIEIRGVPTAYMNALRRTVTDEMPGRALQVPVNGFDANLTTDPFMLPHFVNVRIQMLPLSSQIPSDIVSNLRLSLDVTNRTAAPLSVYSGDLVVTAGKMPEPLFNPTFKLAFLQPGKRIVITNIRIGTGYGRDNGAFIVARRGAYRHLDIEQFSDADMRLEGGVAVDSSGYKVSCLVANPRHHVLTATLAATRSNLAASRAVFADACGNIKERLRLIATTIERRAEVPSGGFGHRGIQYTVVELKDELTEGILHVPGETHTIGEALRRTVYELTPDIANVAYSIVAHENRMTFTLRHVDDVTSILQDAVRHLIDTFDTIQRGIGAK
jgi:DNA-directed RNA polymerase subunit L